MIATRSILPVVVIVLAAAAPPARAQTAEAETLFREGKRLMKKGKIAEACDKLDASDRLEPTVGTELNLADCREKNGQLATAWALFVKAAATAKHADDGKRAAEARRRAAALEPQLFYLTIAVAPEVAVDGLVIKRNDTAIDRALWNQRVPVDPDDYEISGTAPGYEPWSTSVSLKTKSKRVEVPALDKLPEPRRAAKRAEPAASEAIEAPASRFTGRRKLALVLGAVGVVAAGTGLGFALHARSLEDDANTTCPETACTDGHAVDLNHQARTQALYANAGFAVGGALVVTAAILWWTGAPERPGAVSVAPSVGADHVGLGVTAVF